jgi:hypothetical protein
MAPNDDSSDDGRTGRVPRLTWAKVDRKSEQYQSKSARQGTKRFNSETSHLSDDWNPSFIPRSAQITTDRDLLISIKAARRRRDTILGKRVIVRNQRNNYRHQRDAVHQARNKFLLAAKNLRSHLKQQSVNPDSFEYKLFEEAFAELGKLNHHLDEVESTLQKADRDLDVRESRLSTDERKIYEALGRYVEHSPSRDQIGPPKPSSRRSSSSSSSSSNATEPLATEYYESAGTVKILRERLHNKQVQHLQDVSLRQNLIEVGKLPQPPEKVFRKGYYVDLSALYSELITAKTKSTTLKKACAEENIALSDDGDSHPNSEALHLTLDLDRQLIRHAATVEDNEEREALLSNFLSGYMDPKTKVSDWLIELPQREKTSSDDLPEIKHLEDTPGWPDDGTATSNAPTSRILLNSSNTRTSMVPAISSEQGRIEGEMIDWSVISSKKSLPISQRSNDFVGEAPKRRYSDGMIERPPSTSFEDEVYIPRSDQKRPSSASGAFVLERGTRYLL